MGLRDTLRRLRREASEDLASFELLDGSFYRYDPLSWELFMHWYECCGKDTAHDWPPPPEIMQKLTEARDPESALDAVVGQAGFGGMVYDPEVLIAERRLVPRGLISRYDPHLGKHVVLDPYDSRVEDLSEQAKDARNSP
jgi:hypothetical protein